MERSTWSRDTQWRQGSVIPGRTSLSLGLIDSANLSSQLAIVISHDCDIVDDNLENEPTIEVIVGEFIEDALPNHTHAKSPNKLHLEISVDGQPRFIELLAPRKHQIKKAALSIEEPDRRFLLSRKNREILQVWLSFRYKRAAFPDALNKHLSILRDTLQKIGKKNPMAVIGFYFDFDPDEEILASDEPYELWIVVVFNHEIADAENSANEIAQKISEKIKAKFKTATGWQYIELRECVARSDQEFSLYDAMIYRNYPLDYISLRSSNTSE